jgi:hypothetical protein
MSGLKGREIEVISDTEFLLVKRSAINNIEILLSHTQEKLIEIFKNSKLPFPQKNDFSKGKISRGENYRGLPFLVLDYPALFSKDHIFALRTMFYWGHFFSVTLHLQGEPLEHYRDSIHDNFKDLLGKNIYCSVGDSPWEYHYGSDNYEQLSKSHQDFIQKCSFLKLSKKIEIKDWKQLPEFAAEFFKMMLGVLE